MEKLRQHEERARRRTERMLERADRHARRAAERSKVGGARWESFGFVLNNQQCQSGGRAGAWVGVIIVSVGVGLLLQNFGVLPFREFIEFWPLILIVAGTVRIVRAKFVSARAFGFFIMIAGVIALLDNLGVVTMSWNMFWPALLIFWGIKHLLRNFDSPVAAAAPLQATPPPVGNPLGDWNTAGKTGPETPMSGPRAANDAPPPTPPLPQPTSLGPNVYLHEYCIFTGAKRRIVCDNFRGGELVAAFGGIDVDLRNCVMGGPEATIDVTAAFGGCTIRVPMNWYVEMRCVAAFGGSSNKTLPPRGGPGQIIPKLIITGSAAFGGVVVEN